MKSIIVLLCGVELPSANAVDVSRSNTKDTKKCRQVQVKSSPVVLLYNGLVESPLPVDSEGWLSLTLDTMERHKIWRHHLWLSNSILVSHWVFIDCRASNGHWPWPINVDPFYTECQKKLTTSSERPSLKIQCIKMNHTWTQICYSTSY